LFAADAIGQHDDLVQTAIGNAEIRSRPDIQRWHVAFDVVARRNYAHGGDFEFRAFLSLDKGTKRK